MSIKRKEGNLSLRLLKLLTNGVKIGEKVVRIVTIYCELDKDFKNQLNANTPEICEDHCEESCLIRRK